MKGIYDNINFNCNLTRLKSFANSNNLIKYIWDNVNHIDSPETIHKEIENKTLKDWRKDANYEKDLQLLETNKNIKLRFFISTFNLIYTKENEYIILEWANELMKYLETKFNIIHSELHLNMTRPHIHVIILNTDSKREKIGNFNKYDENIKLSGKYYVDKLTGEKIFINSRRLTKIQNENKNFFKENKLYDYGRVNLNKIWKDGTEIVKKICEKYNLNFEQKPTSEWAEKRKEKREKLKNLTTEEFRQVSWKIDNNYLFYENKIKDLENEIMKKDQKIKELEEKINELLGK